MSDLHARLLAAVRQRMETAQTADEWWIPFDDRDNPCYDCSGWHAQQAAHINANDPATILRHCERDLKVLERHRPTDEGVCPVCVGEPEMVEEWDAENEDESVYWESRPLAWPCAEITDLAAAYGIEADDG